MIIGVPKELKVQEHRVGMTPAGVRTLIEDGHRVLVQSGAGAGSGLSDAQYAQAGATLLDNPAEIYAAAQLVVKVKEPLPLEYPLLRSGQLLFTYLHLAPDPAQAEALLACGCTAIAYETVTRPDGTLPLLIPMSEIAGRMAAQVGAHWLQKEQGGKGVLLAGAPGVRPGRVVILGAGTVGSNALRIAVGMGADVTVFDLEPAPKLVPRELVVRMEPGSVVVDVAVDQGGCVATTRPTTHDRPVYLEAGVLHYGVANMPGAVSRTSTFALTNATLPYVRQLAGEGFAACQQHTDLRQGVNVHAGAITHPAVAWALGRPCRPLPL
jgi:alanine dehydrogenase